MNKVVIFARVSTISQDYERQLNDLREYAKHMGYNVVKEYAEKISGAKRVVERETMSELLSFVEANHIDKVLIYECSRLSRRVADFINIVDKLNELRKMVSWCNDWIDENVAHSEQTPYTCLCDAESHLNRAIQSVSDFVGCCAKSVMHGEKFTLPTSNVESDERQD